MASTGSSRTPVPSVRIERTFAAPTHRVYRAWLDPELLGRWLAPGDTEVSHVEVEERVGGRYRIWQAYRGEPRGGCEGEVVELGESGYRPPG